jgi:acetylornithine deacetylase
MLNENPLDLALRFLSELVSRPSFSREEDRTASFLVQTLGELGHTPQRVGNNVWVASRQWLPGRPTILLCSHHDTVRPVAGWQRDPFTPTIEGDCFYGLGSNDAGGALITYLIAFLQLEPVFTQQGVNLVWAAAAEEEISGVGGIAALWPLLPTIHMALVGEPTGLQAAVAEKGLLVLDIEVKGRSGHAARNEGLNAIELALPAIQWLSSQPLTRPSALLGPAKVTVTQIIAGTQHNVIPDTCRVVADVRVNDAYHLEEVVHLIENGLQQLNIPFELTPRSLRLRPSALPMQHPLFQAAHAMGWQAYGSPTLSDMAQIPAPSLKWGPGQSARSHTADEFILVSELRQGLEELPRFLHHLAQLLTHPTN